MEEHSQDTLKLIWRSPFINKDNSKGYVCRKVLSHGPLEQKFDSVQGFQIKIQQRLRYSRGLLCHPTSPRPESSLLHLLPTPKHFFFSLPSPSLPIHHLADYSPLPMAIGWDSALAGQLRPFCHCCWLLRSCTHVLQHICNALGWCSGCCADVTTE